MKQKKYTIRARPHSIDTSRPYSRDTNSTECSLTVIGVSESSVTFRNSYGEIFRLTGGHMDLIHYFNTGKKPSEAEIEVEELDKEADFKY